MVAESCPMEVSQGTMVAESSMECVGEFMTTILKSSLDRLSASLEKI
jgi:hypothetical protein